MLDRLRKGASGWVAQLLITLLVLSFAIWGVNDVFRGFGADTLARVGSVDITIPEFQRQYDLAVRRLSQQTGQPLTQEQARLFGVPQQVLGTMVADATLNDLAGDFGLGISNQTLAQQIAEDPAFQGSNGTFDRGYFSEVLRQAGMSEDQYIDDRRAFYVRQQIADALAGGTRVPEAYLRALHEYRNEERKLGYLLLTPALVGDPGEPTDADLTSYFDANKASWRAPEYRTLSILRMAPTDLAQASEVSDDEARTQYDRQIASFTTPERRQVFQIVFPSRAEAEQAAAALSAGKSFDDLLAERKIKPADADLGLVTRDKIIDPKIVEAAFSLAPNSVSGIVEGQFGPAIVRVTTVEPQVVKPFDEVGDQIKQDIANDRAAADIADQRDVIEDARAAGETLEEIGQKYGLKLMAVPAVDKSGNDQQSQPIKDLPGGTALLNAAFDTDVGIANDPIPLDNGFVWFDVTAVTAPRDRELNEVRDKVVAAWKKSEVDKRLDAKAADLRDRLSKGEDIAKVAADNQLEVKTADKVTRGTAPEGDLSTQAIAAAFGGPEGTAAVAPGSGDQTRLVLIVTDVLDPPYLAGPETEQTQAQLSDQMADDFLQQYLAQLRSQLDIELNQAALEQALGPVPGS